MGRLIRLDWAIKNILRQKANFEILEGFLSELLSFDVTISEILESESNKAHADAKQNRVDILVRDQRDELILVEFQTELEIDYLQRILFGSSMLVVDYLRQGEPYAKIRKIYTISIVYFDLGVGKDYIYHGQTRFEGLRRKDHLKLDAKQQAAFQVTSPEGLFPEHFIIKVPQYDNKIRDTLDEWIYFLKNEEIKNDFKAKGIQSAYEKLEVLKLPEAEQKQYRRYLHDLHYHASMVYSTWDTGIATGGSASFILSIRAAEASLGLPHEDQETLERTPVDKLESKAQELWARVDQEKEVAKQQSEQERQARVLAQQQTEQEREARVLAQQQTEQEREARVLAQQQTEQEREARVLAQQQTEQAVLKAKQAEQEGEKERQARLRLEQELAELRARTQH